MLRLAMVAAALAFMTGTAAAGPTCTSEPKDKWLNAGEMKAKIAQLGYKFKVFKVTTGNCYEIYGHDASGTRVEVYFHPVTGAVVEEHKS